MSKKITYKNVTREQLGEFMFEHGMDFEDLQLNALWAMMVNSKDKSKAVEIFMRYLMEDDVANERMTPDNLAQPTSDPWV